ncbi:hypothetical protein ASD56_07745 [Microbacterium sp. Root166]|uniref:cell division protein PerM n=1 Tax=Microbacterium sp. Root166 TaxID=1736478 RepID=UPI0006F7F6EC|nr:DUF6350 family protein [Microbacterium sp. Root166]KQZ86141.1 hypothetical protein ASD56_07745 [Microbacterium sp. Root166]
MHRLIVAVLAAVDAAIAAAVGVAAILAPFTLLWVFGLGAAADWATLWPSAVTVWQFGHLVPVAVTLPAEYIVAAGIDPAAASFVLSLAPLAFAAFTGIFAARSGVRASQADAWLTGVLTGTIVFGGLTALAALTAQNLIADTELWQAMLLPTLIFALPALGGAVVTEWREAGAGLIARLRERVEAARHGWSDVPALIARGTAVVVVGLVGLGAVLTAVALLLQAGEVVSLYQAGNVDALGATLLTLAQAAYLPVLLVWGIAFAAGPGFAVGTDSAVSPAGTQAGVVPGVPILGILPESTTPWLLLLALIPVALGAFAGWIARSRFVHAGAPAAVATAPESPVVVDDARTAAVLGLLSPPVAPEADVHDSADDFLHDDHEPIAARLVVVAGITVLSAAAAALLSAAASGSLGPGRLAEFGPQPGAVALGIGLEVLVGAAILLLAPLRRAHHRIIEDSGVETHDDAERMPQPPAPAEGSRSEDLNATLDLGPR